MGAPNPRYRELSSSSRRRPFFLCSRRCCTTTLFLFLLLLSASYLAVLHLSHTHALPQIASSIRNRIRPTAGEKRGKPGGGGREAGNAIFPINVIEEKVLRAEGSANGEARSEGTVGQIIDTKIPGSFQSGSATAGAVGQGKTEKREAMQAGDGGDGSRLNDPMMMTVMAALGEAPCMTLAGQPCSEEETTKGPPAALMVDMPLSDDDVALQKAVAARFPTGQQPVLREGVKPRVAFLFLTRGPMPLARVWERFFQGHESRYSIYLHANPGFEPPPNTSHLFASRYIASEPVRWGYPSMVTAERRLLSRALLRKSNTRFVLLSESCMPLHDFSFTYDYLMGSNTSLIHSFCDQTWNCGGRYSIRMDPVISRHNWRKGSQWWALTWRHAFLAATDVSIYPVLARWCRGDSWHRHCFLDEHYFQTLLQIHDPSRVAGRGPTLANWAGGAHPVTYAEADFTPGFLAKFQALECRWRYPEKHEPCFLFLRKIAPSAVTYLLSLPKSVLDF